MRVKGHGLATHMQVRTLQPILETPVSVTSWAAVQLVHQSTAQHVQQSLKHPKQLSFHWPVGTWPSAPVVVAAYRGTPVAGCACTGCAIMGRADTGCANTGCAPEAGRLSA